MNDRKINWTISSSLMLITVGAIYGVTTLVIHDAIVTKTLIWSIMLVFLTGMSITGGYHRLFAHKAYKARLPVKLFYLLFGTMSAEGSVMEWCTDHRMHHLYTDTDKDPYSAKKGFFYSHMGWLFMIDQTNRTYENVKDLEADPLIAFQHHYYIPLMLVSNIIMSVGVASLWGDAWGGLWLAGFARLMANHHSTFLVNSWAHFFGKQPFSSHCTARDSLLVGFLAHGEGYHNYHHQFAADYRNAIRWYQYDPTKWMIFLFYKLGLAYDLKRIQPRVVMAYKMKRLAELAMSQAGSQDIQLDDYIKPFKLKLNHYFDQLDQLKEDYQSIKQEKLNSVKSVHKAKCKQIKLRKKEITLQIRALLNEAELSMLTQLAHING